MAQGATRQPGPRAHLVELGGAVLNFDDAASKPSVRRNVEKSM